MQRLRETLTLALLALLPLHAFGVTVLTKWIAGPGHAPLPWLALWKEALLIVILVVALVEIVIDAWQKPSGRAGRAWSWMRVHVLRRKAEPESGISIDVIDVFILIQIALSLRLYGKDDLPSSVGLYALGFKYDFVPLIAFMVLRRVEWSDAFRVRVVRVIMRVGAIVAAYGIATFFLPQTFFTALGYSDLHSLYVPGGPLAAFQQIGGSSLHRIQSTFSGPNQFGLWLLLPWSVALVKLLRGDRRAPLIGIALLVGVAIVLTFSRSAWIGAALIAIVAVASLLRTRGRRAMIILVGGLVGVAFVVGAVGVMVFPNALVRVASSRDHVLRPLAAVQKIIEHPFGLGLGSAGPASNRVSDACVHLEAGSDVSWAADRPDLCVFVADEQVQPPLAKRACNCPFLPENWYLQIGVELGVIGVAVFVAMIVLVMRALFIRQKESTFHVATALAFLGVSIAALFLHAWEDSAVAYTVWVLIATLPLVPRRS